MESEHIPERTTWQKLGYTPLGDLVRGRISGSLDHRVFIRASGLPEPAEVYVVAIIKRTGHLWLRERVALREKLIGVMARQLTAGRDLERIKSRLGSPRRAARRLIKDILRRRPRWSKVARKTLVVFSAVWLAVALILLASGVVFALFDRARPSVDYLAKINAPALALPVKDRAWPVYRQAILASSLHTGDDAHTIRLKGRWSDQTPDFHKQVQAVVQENALLIQAVRRGVALPGLGLTIPPRGEFTGDDAKAIEMLSGLSHDSNPLGQGDRLLLSSVVIPDHLGAMRFLNDLMRLDMFVAADQKQMGRVMDDFRAMLGLAGQLRELPLYFCELTSMSTTGSALQSMGQVLEDDTAALSDAQLREVRQQLVLIDGLTSIDLTGPRYVLMDTLQRNYAPSGRIASDNMLLSMADGQKGHFFTKMMLLPWMNLFLPGPKQVRGRVEQVLDESKAYNHLPLWKQLQATRPYEKYQAEKDAAGLHGLAAFVSLENLLVRDWCWSQPGVLRAWGDALNVAVALEEFRRAEHHYPDSLALLVPKYLPKVPLDYSTGRPLLYKLVDDKPLLYGRGRNGDDDGGVNIKDTGPDKDPVHRQGDWILYPQVESER